ncbi:MAG TPA: D-2-hydroxyacid dehydrogenase [Cytophagaceae bacterium]|jgi:lactate dehydrogenase-like 2-hydroxyacid dehydrogenase|nr:D-2-hydroxyacid dehydrogenase [Cytophagaceae bacterium]
MKLVLLDAKTLGELKELELLRKYGELVVYQYTTSDEVVERVSDADIIITNKVIINRQVMDHAANLKLICVAATGMNNIELDYAALKGIQVKNVKGYSTEGVAQHTFALILYILNHISLYDQFVKNKSYSGSTIFTHHAWPIHELGSMKFGIIGLGAIGEKVGEIAKAFGAEVRYYSTSGNNTNEKFKRVSLEELLKNSDIISIHAPLNETTTNLISYKELIQMKPTSILVNTGRGGIINEGDLAKIIDEERILAAALDVFEKEPLPDRSPLLFIRNHDRLIVTPHIAWAGVESRKRLIEGICRNIEEFLN